MSKDWVDEKRISKHPEYTLVFRGMDSHGITNGALLEEAVNISEQVHELNELEKRWWSLKNIKSSRCLKYLSFAFLFDKGRKY